MNDAVSAVTDALVDMGGSTARESRLLVEAGPVYLMFSRAAGERFVRVEAVGSTRLPAEFKLSQARATRLRDLGFNKRDGAHRNWVKTIEHPQFDDLALETDRILREVYGIKDPPRLSLTEDDRDHPHNPDLFAAMRVVAKGQFDEDTRRAMYTELVNAVLLVPLDRDATDAADMGEEYHVFERMHDRPVFGVFSDWASLRLWEPRGWDYLPVHGSELFENVVEQNVATVKINPGGDVGGELYRNELDMLVDAVRKFRRKTFN